MARDVHIPLPPDLDLASPEAVAVLEDRLRRLSDALAGLQKQVDKKADR